MDLNSLSEQVDKVINNQRILETKIITGNEFSEAALNNTRSIYELVYSLNKDLKNLSYDIQAIKREIKNLQS